MDSRSASSLYVGKRKEERRRPETDMRTTVKRIFGNHVFLSVVINRRPETKTKF